jgi:hypothetical protein
MMGEPEVGRTRALGYDSGEPVRRVGYKEE